MSNQSNQEKFTLTKEQMNDAFEAQVTATMDALMADESFSEEQKGEVKVWLKQIYYLGREHGKSETVIEHLPEEAIDKFVGVFQKLIGATSPEEGSEDYKTEAMLYKILYHQEQQISSSYQCQAMVYRQKMDGTLGKPTAFCIERR